MKQLFSVFVLVLGALLSVAHAGNCDTKADDSRGVNLVCSQLTAPFCLPPGSCYQCNPSLGKDYMCDCPDAKACMANANAPTYGFCVASVDKQGTTCSTSSDCTSTYYGGVQQLLDCVAGKCQQCDYTNPMLSTPRVCAYGVRRNQTVACVAPGVWSSAAPVTTTTAPGPASPAPTPTASGQTNGSSAHNVGSFYYESIVKLVLAVFILFFASP